MSGEIATLAGGGGGVAGLGIIWYLFKEIGALKIKVAEQYVNKTDLHDLKEEIGKRFDRLEGMILNGRKANA